MTAQITTIPGGTAQVAVSGTTIQVEPGVQYEIADIAPDGSVGQALTARQLIMAPNVPDLGDLSVTLPDGTVLVFKGLIELFGSGAGLSVGDDLIASLEDAISPAAGPTPGGPDAGGSSQAFNARDFHDPLDPGETEPGPIDNPDDPLDPLGDPDPNDFIEPLDPDDPDDPGRIFDILFTPRDDEAFMDRGVPLFLEDGSVNPGFAPGSGSSGNVDPVTRNVTHALENDDLVHLDDKDGINNLHDLFGEPTAFYGGEGDDTLFGGTDHDIIVGDGLKAPSDGKGTAVGGNDTIEGNDGDDTLIGDGLVGAPGVKMTMDIGFPNPVPFPDELELINMKAMNAPDSHGGEGHHGRSDKFDSLGKLLDQFNLGLFGPGGFLDFANDLKSSSYSFSSVRLIGGDDLMLGGEGSDLVVGDAIVNITPCGISCDDPWFFGPTSRALLVGGDDEIIGDVGNDFLIGDGIASLPSSLFRPGGTGYGYEGILKALEGADSGRITAIGGDDEILAGEGHDFVMGDGIVVIGGGEGGDDFFPVKEVAVDNAFGGEGTVFGGEGADVYVQGGDDDLYGDSGDDTMIGDGIVVVTEGGEGNITRASIYGGEAEVVIEGGDDYMFGGEGYDNMIGDGIIVATPDLNQRVCNPCVTFCGPHGTDAIVYGGDDLMVGGEGGDHMVGDGIYVIEENSRYNGKGDGQTVVYAGDDDMFGGEGDDTMIGDGVGTVGSYVLGHGEITGETWMHLLWAFEDDRDGDDCKNGHGGGHGGEGNLLVFAGNDFMFGGDGDDYMRGDGIQGFYLDGNDVMFGGEGDDLMFGELGHDLVVGDGLLNLRGGSNGKNAKIGGEGFGLDIVEGNVVVGGDDVLFGGDERRYFDDSDDFFGIDDIVIGDGIVSLPGESDDESPSEPSPEPTLLDDESPTYLVGGDDVAFGGTGNDAVIGDGIIFVGGETGDGKDPAPSEPGNDDLSPRTLGDDPTSYEALLTGGNDELWGDNGGFGGEGGKDWIGFGGEGGDDLVVGDLLVAVTGSLPFGEAGDIPKPSKLEGGDDDIVGGGGNDILIGDGNILIPGAAEAVNELIAILGDIDPLELLSNPALLDQLLATAADLIDEEVLVAGGNLLIGGDDVIYGDNAGGRGYGDCGPVCGPICGGADGDFDNGFDDTIIGDGLAVLGVGVRAGGPNVLEGGHDKIHGQEGNDILIGDLLISNFAGDQMVGGNDEIHGGEGSDVILGDGNVDQDIFQNTSLNDLLEDPLDAVTGDVLRTDADPDIQGGDDELYGGDGDDVVLGEGGDDTVDGGDGEDLVAGGTGEDLGIWSGPTIENDPEPEPDSPEPAFTDDDDDDQLDGGPIPGAGGFTIGERDFYHGNGVQFTKDGDNVVITDETRDGPGAEQDVIDTLRLVLTEEQFSNPEVIADLLRFQQHLADGNDDTVFDFDTLPLTVVDWEEFEVALHGCEDLVLTNIISVDDLGTSDAMGTDENDLIVGDDDVNTIEGKGGDDLIFALGDDDTVYGDDQGQTDGPFGNDKIVGGEGQDFLVGDSHSVDTSFAGRLGDDIIYGDNLDGGLLFGNESDQIYGDVVESVSGPGTGGNDKLIGGEGFDQIFGDTGGDMADGFTGGDDWISGGQKSDNLFGDAGGTISGNDTMGGDDHIYGGESFDFISGDAGNELRDGAQGGDDYIDGGEGGDLISGDAAQDIYNAGGDDAGGGDDTITGGAGNDALYGGTSGNILQGGDDGDDLITGDFMAYGFGGGGTFEAYDDIISGDAGGNIDGFESGGSSGGDDDIVGDNRFVQGGEGGKDDDGKGGKDGWFLGGGNYTFEMGEDTIYGDAGNNIQSASMGGDDDIVGDNLFVSEGDYGANLFLNFTPNGKNDGSDWISGDAGNNIEGGLEGSSNDSLGSHGGDDAIVGDNDIEPLLSLQGSSAIEAGASSDMLFGDAGNDIIRDSSGGDDDITGDNFLDLSFSGLFHGGEGHGGHGDDCDDEWLDDRFIRFIRGDATVNLDAADDNIYGDAGNNIQSASMGGDDFIVGDNWVQFSGVENGKFFDFGGWGNFKSIYDLEIHAQAGNDSIFGDAGNDIVDGSQGGDDVIYGDNLFEGFPREDRKDRPDDKFFGGEGKPFGGEGGFDVDIWDAGGNDLISGDAGGEITDGSSGGNDEIYGQGGNDTIAGDAIGDISNNSSGGNDLIFGGEGNDTIAADAGGDIIGGSHGGDDTVYGGEGDDLITGDAGGIDLGGDTGDDVEGDGSTAGDDVLHGDAGNDDIYGDALDDITRGADSAGDDELYGGEGDDFLVGDSGGSQSSTEPLDDAGDDELYGGEGQDILFGDGANGIDEQDVRNALSAINAGNALNDSIINTINDLRDTEVSTGGNDTLDGGTGADAVFGGAGSDLGIHANPGEGGDDTISYYDGGGVGNDDFGHKSGVDDNGDMDTLRLVLTADQMVDADVWEEINDFLDHINGGNDDEPFYFETLDLVAVEWEKLELALYECPDHVFTIDDIIFGDDGANTLVGMDGNDTIFGLGNDDQLQGEMNGSPSFGDDLLVGGDGNDEILGDQNEQLENGEVGGSDKLIGGEGQDVIVGDTGTSDEGESSDIETGARGGNDKIFGGDNNDDLFGDAFDDLEDEGSQGGNDYIDGGEGDDNIFGDAGGELREGAVGGDDEIHGGEGRDEIHGDVGASDLNTTETDSGNILDGAQGGDDKIWGGDDRDLITGDAGGDIRGEDSRGGNDWIGGGEGGDRISGDAAGNIIDGSGGDDDIEGNHGSDQLFGDAGISAKSISIGGGEGGDIIGGEGGHDWISGGEGGDRISGDAARDIALGGEGGDDYISGGEGEDQIAGDAGRDLTALSDNELVEDRDPLASRGGNDYIEGGEGGDLISGDAGRAILGGSSGGDDWIDGGEGRDVIVGDAGEDIGDDQEGIASFGGDDQIHGGEGGDLISGDAGNDIEGGSSGGDDWINGGEGDDDISGDAGRNIGDNDEEAGNGSFGGDDYIGGGEGQDVISGDAGNDLLNGSKGGHDYIWGDEGVPHFGGEGNGNGTIVNNVGVDFITDLDDDGDYDDYLAGDAGNAIIESHGGWDTIFGGRGSDFISGDAGTGPQREFLPDNDDDDDDDGPDSMELAIGGEGGDPDLVASFGGDDYLVGGEGGDYITGDAFDDVEAGSLAGDDDIYGGEGHDVITGDAWDDIEAETDTIGQSGAVIAAAASLGGDDLIVGGEGHDWISGDAGDAILDGSRGGDDHIFGDGHEDEAWFRGAADWITGDAGGDIGNGSLGGDDVILGGDEIGKPFIEYFVTPSGKEIAIGGEGDNIFGDAGGSITGDSHGGDDRIFGGEGDDNLTGDAGGFIGSDSTGGDDVIYGGEGDDYIFGDAGKVTLVRIESEDDSPSFYIEEISGALEGNARGGDDELFGGEGYDLVIGDAPSLFDDSVGGADWIYGGGDDDELIGDGKELADNAIGGNDGIYGDDGDDFVVGDGKALLDDASGGDDTIYGGYGNDDLYGDALIDNGNGGDDRVFGEYGDDFLDGNSGFDSVFGGAGNDIGQWSGGAPDDAVAGPRDDYDGNQGDTQEGQDADGSYDTLLLSLGEDQLEDDDVLEEIAEFLAHISGSDGNGGTVGDDVSFTFQTLALTAIEWEKVEIALTGCEDHAILLEMQEVGDDLANTLTGGAVNDLIIGLGGNDDIAGDDGGEGSDDALFGGDGDDKLFGDQRGDLVMDGGDDLLVGGAGNDLLVGDTGEPDGDDVESDGSTTGNGGDDKLLGGDGEDTLFGDAIDDVKEGGQGGDDILFGGANDDILVGDAGNGIRTDGTIGSHGGDDQLFGGSGNDTLYGDAALDLGNGDPDAASIEEGSTGGDDLLEGGSGDDVLWGDGPGAADGTGGMDTFVFDLAELTGDDVIKDFELDNDTLLFEDVLGGDSIADLDALVTVTEDGDDVVITRNDGGGSIRIEGIADESDFGSIQDLQDTMSKEIEINPETLIVV